MTKQLHRLLLLITAVSMALLAVTPPQIAQGATIPLSPCKFDVGIGAAKYPVEAQCAVISVPEDWHKPDGRKLDLHVTVLPATGPDKKPEPIFHFEGGPGASAITNFGETFFAAYRDLRQDHDVVLVDQRGTGLSSSLQCTEATDKALEDLGKPEESDEGTATFITRLNACLTRLSATTDPAFYTSTVLADDTDAVRAALGYDQIDVIGVSYGTWLGQIYLRRHGEHVHAMVLDSLAGPWNFYLLGAANNAQTSLDKIFALCQSDKDCNQKYPDLPGKLKSLLAKLEKQPANTTGLGALTGKAYPVVITRNRFLETLRSMMYLSANIGVIPQAISQAANAGDYTLPAAQMTLEAEIAPQVSLGLYYSVHCSESLPFYTPEILKQVKPGAFYGLGDKNVEQLKAVCKAWRSAELGPEDVAPVKSDRPVLIMVGAFDPITAPAFAQEAHQRLTHSSLALFPYQAHGPIIGSKCAQNLVERFFNAPVEPVDTSCTAQDIKPVFLGAYQVQLVPYADPKGRFNTSIPKDWKVQPQSPADAAGKMTFFTSPDGLQFLGVGNFRGMNAADAQKAALEIIGKTYGPVDVQLSQSFLFLTVVQHSLDRPDQAYIGALLIRSLGTDTQVVWQAAPGNIFQAALLPIAIPVFTSLVVH